MKTKNYMKRKTKTYTKKGKTGLNSISAWSSSGGSENPSIYRQNPEGRGVRR